jgi:hypothetical protein
MKGLGCDNTKCIYSNKAEIKYREYTTTKAMILNGKCVIKCYQTDINSLMIKFRGGRNNQRITGMLKW